MDTEAQVEEIQSLKASFSPKKYDSTSTHFLNVQIDLLPDQDDLKSDQSPQMCDQQSRFPSRALFNLRRDDKIPTGSKSSNMTTPTTTMSEPESPDATRKPQLPPLPPPIPQFSYYRYAYKPKPSTRSSGDETFDTLSTSYSESKRGANATREQSFSAPSRFNGKPNFTSREQSTQTMTLGTRHRMESSESYHYFSLHEDFDGAVIDVQKSFAPKNLCGIPVIFRLLFCYLTYRVLEQDYWNAILIRESDTTMFFSHLTNITLMVSLLYQFLSSILSILALAQRKPTVILNQPKRIVRSSRPFRTNNDAYQLRPSVLVCFVWLLYSIVLPGEFVVAFGYWSLDAGGPETTSFINLYKHGYIGILLLLDGLGFARIPLRVKHLNIVFTFGVIYTMWTMIVSFFRMGKNDGVIYEFIDWRNYPHQTAAILFFLLGVMLPFFFYLFWLVSFSDGCCCLCTCGFNGELRRIYSGNTVIQSNPNYTVESDDYSDFRGPMDICPPADIGIENCEETSFLLESSSDESFDNSR